MRQKRTRREPAAQPGDDHPPDATGLTIDWIGTQETGGGGATFPWFVVVALVALRALPFLVRKAAQRRRGRARGS